MRELVNSLYFRIFLAVLAALFLLMFIFNNFLSGLFLSYLELYRYVTLFLVVFLGGLCIPLPANVFLIAMGALSSQHQFSLWDSILIATLANVMGDLIAYAVFKKYGHAILRDQYVSKYPFFLRLEEFFHTHARISIFVSRIIGLFGTPVNFLAGYLKTPISTFAIFDFLGNLIYAIIFLCLGYWVGDRWQLFSNIINIFMNLVGIGMFVGITIVLWKTRKKPEVTL
ncbi:MAG: DedA family protein [Patescibacteria group bacterium]